MLFMKRRALVYLVVALLWALASAGLAVPAAAHIDIRPLESPPEIWQIYSLVVPTEDDSPTVKVELRIPATFEIEAIHHDPAWRLNTTRNPQGMVTSIAWSGSSIPTLTFKEFKFFAKNPKAPGVYKWETGQTFADGRRSAWTAQSRVTGASGGPGIELAVKAAEQATTLSYLAIALGVVMILVVLVGLLRGASG